MKRYKKRIPYVCRLIVTGALLGIGSWGNSAHAETEEPSQSSGEWMVPTQQDNGYGVGALIKSQEKGNTELTSNRTHDTVKGVSTGSSADAIAAAEAVRRARAAEGQLQNVKRDLTALQTQLKTAQQQLADAQAHTALTPDLSSLSGKQAYVAGQSIAAELRERLRTDAEAGVALDKKGIIAGISDGLNSTLRLKKSEMDEIYRQFADSLQAGINQRVQEGESLLAKKAQGRTPAKQVAGITYYVMKKGKAVNDPDAPVSLSLKESMAADGHVLSRVPSLTLAESDDMPAVIREALPLLGEGSDVEAYALARSVYGTRPLPRGVSPFTLLRYDMQGITASHTNPLPEKPVK
ncbi:FKBP-type peptidyl-prolyl cis-trans isomerase N-terminal domain-containing protein [Enterobacter cloacae]|uniref:FKBP-type peptidyl-prolyl cis-trans isomerase N-terminal domain-containing protein n=1 Tax=Enterobacter cloacae TaxID=550 RepID=UPI0034A52505